MLSNTDAVATVAVKNLDTARKFYEEKLGLKAAHTTDGEVVTYRTGGARLNVYRSQYAGTNKATAVTWTVGNEFDRTLQELKSKGVTFEHYDMPGLTLEGDVHRHGDMKVAWFKDPDGNILNIVNQ